MNISGTNFIKSIFKFSIASWVNFFISISSVMITTRIFSPDIYGNLSMFNTATSLFMGIVCLGLDSSFMRFYNEPPKGYDTKQLLAKCMGIPVLFLIIIIVLFAPLFYKDVSFFLFNRISWLIIALLCINTMSLVILNFFLTCYRISNNAKRYTIQSILTQFFTKMFVITAVLINPNFDTIIIVNTTGVFILTIIYFAIQKKESLPKKINWSMKGFSEIFKFALYSWPIVILIYFNSFFSQIIISKNLGSYALGIYVSTAFFVGALGVIQNGFKTFWVTFMYGNYKSEQLTIIKVHDYVVLFVISILSLFIIFQHILYQLIGSDYHASRYFFTLILVYPLFNLISETTAYGITIAKKTQYQLIVFIVSTIVNLIFSYLLLKYFGIIGVAIALTLSAIVQVGLSSIIGQKYYKSIKDPRKTLVSIILIIILASSNCIFADRYLIELLIVFVLNAIAMFIYKKEMIELFRLGNTAINRRKKS